MKTTLKRTSCYLAIIKNQIPLFLILLFSLILYWKGLIDLPRRDQICFLSERINFPSNFDWLIHTLSWNRTRLFEVGDYYLFRPFHMVLIAMTDIFFREYPMVSGLISILYLGLAGWSLYLIVNKLISNAYLGLLFALCFITQYASQDIVLWRHISPYLLSLFFWGIGIYFLCSANRHQKKSTYYLAASFFFIACCFHEIIALALFITSSLLYLFTKTSSFRFKKKLYFCAMPAIGYLFINLFDFLYYHPGKILGPSDSIHGFEPFKIISSIWLTHAASFSSFLFPFAITIKDGKSGISSWSFLDIGWLLHVGGIVGLIFIILLIIKCSNRIFKLTNKKDLTISTQKLNNALLVFTFSLSAYLSYLVAIGFGRVYLRGISYLSESIYYYAFSTYFILLMFVSGLAFFDSLSRKNRTLIQIFLASLILVNYYSLNQSLLIYQHNQIKNLSIIYKAKSVFKTNPNICVAGFSTSNLISTYAFLPFYIENESCTLEKNIRKTPVILYSDELGNIRNQPTYSISASSYMKGLGPEGLSTAKSPGWHAVKNPTYPQTLTLDFHGIWSFNQISFLAQENYLISRAPKHIRIETSNDGESWVTIASSKNICTPNTSDGWHNYKLPKTFEARYLKIEILSNCGDTTLLTLKGLQIK